MRTIGCVILAWLAMTFLTGCREVAYGLYYAPMMVMGPIAVATLPERAAKMERENHPMTVAGVVVDEEGREISGVHLLVRYSRSVATTFGGESEYQATAHVIGGHFAENVPGKIWGIAVWGEGFYTREYTVRDGTMTLAGEAGVQISDGAKQPLGEARLVLRRHGPLAHLDRRLETLWVDGNGAGVVVAPGRTYASWDSAKWLEDVEKAPADFLYVTTTRSGGQIPKMPVQRTDGDSFGKPAEIRVGVAGVPGGAGNGIILYVPRDEKQVWYEMREAPASGYQPEVTLDAAARRKLADWGGVWFYIKCGEKYGRGQMKEGELSGVRAATVERYGLRVVLEMQGDGTRNLDQDPEDRAGG